MGKVTNPGKGKLPMDMLITTIVALVALLSLAVGDLVIEADVDNYAEEVLPPTEPEYDYIEQEIADIDGYTDEGSTSSLDLGRLLVNTTEIRVELTWQDDLGSNDRLKLALVLNSTEVGFHSDTSGDISISVSDGDLNGTYGIRVTAEDCPGQYPVPIDRDVGNAWNLKVFVTVRYER